MKIHLLALSLMVVPLTACATTICDMPRSERPKDWSSQKFYEAYSEPSIEREVAVAEQFLKGNYPWALKDFRPIKVKADGLTLEFKVAPDYLMIGTDQDPVRAPLSGFAAQFVASALGMVLPTKRMVDWIYEQSDARLAPQPTDWYKEEWKMRHGPNYIVFNNAIEKQRADRTGLIAGHKKDVVISNMLDSAPDRVAIYGWHQKVGSVIQPITTAHANWYEDYSHGIRLVAPWLKVTDADGKVTIVAMIEALKDPALGKILNGGEAPLQDVRAARSCPAKFLAATGLKPENCPPRPSVCAYRSNSAH